MYSHYEFQLGPTALGGIKKKTPQKITDTTGVMASSVSVKKRVVYISVL